RHAFYLRSLRARDQACNLLQPDKTWVTRRRFLAPAVWKRIAGAPLPVASRGLSFDRHQSGCGIMAALLVPFAVEPDTENDVTALTFSAFNGADRHRRASGLQLHHISNSEGRLRHDVVPSGASRSNRPPGRTCVQAPGGACNRPDVPAPAARSVDAEPPC